MLYWTCFQSPVIPLLHHNLWTWKKVKKNNEAVVCLFPKHHWIALNICYYHQDLHRGPRQRLRHDPRALLLVEAG